MALRRAIVEYYRQGGAQRGDLIIPPYQACAQTAANRDGVRVHPVNKDTHVGRFRHAFSRGAVTHRLERKAPSSQLPPAYTQAHHALDEALTQLFLHHEEVTHYRGKAIEYTSKDMVKIMKAIVAWLEEHKADWLDDESDSTYSRHD